MLSGVTSATDPETTGDVLAEKSLPFEIKDSLGQVIFTGVYESTVVRSSVTGTLVFFGRVGETANPPDTFGWATHVRLGGFGWVDTDVEGRTDGDGTVRAAQAGRTAMGDQITFRLGAGLLQPPDESLAFYILTPAVAFTETGNITVFGSNDFGGTSFSAEMDGAFAPVELPLVVSLGERFEFEGLDFHPLVVRGAAQGLKLKVETSPDLVTWTEQGRESPAVSGEVATVYGEVDPALMGRQFFRVRSVLPDG